MRRKKVSSKKRSTRKSRISKVASNIGGTLMILTITCIPILLSYYLQKDTTTDLPKFLEPPKQKVKLEKLREKLAKELHKADRKFDKRFKD